MTPRNRSCIVIATLIHGFAGTALADPVRIAAVMTDREQLKMNFADGSQRYVALMRREGTSSGTGPIAGAKVTELGMHDVTPDVATDTIFYHAFVLPNGDAAYIKSTFRGVTVREPEGKTKNALSGLWEIVSASGGLKGLKGAGTVHLKRLSKEDRQFTFDGDAGLGASGQ